MSIISSNKRLVLFHNFDDNLGGGHDPYGDSGRKKSRLSSCSLHLGSTLYCEKSVTPDNRSNTSSIMKFPLKHSINPRNLMR